MKENCRNCKQIVWFKNDNYSKYFEDSNYKIFHNCPALHWGKKQHWDDHLLLTKTISRISKLEKEVKDLKQSQGSTLNFGEEN